MKDSQIKIKNLTVSFERKKITAVQDLNLNVQEGEFLTLVGTTGCGKSTILNTIAGFVKPNKGNVLINDNQIFRPIPNIGVVFQQHALFPWMTVLSNVTFGPLSIGKTKSDALKIAEKLIEQVGLKGFEQAYPNELSGGMQQRVGLARTLANNPDILLMDEPFGSLDAQTRSIMQELLLAIWRGTKKTVIFVTHDVEEAVFLADRVIVLTARPARIKKEVIVNLPRPRKFDMVTSTNFMKTKKEVLTAIREETLLALNHSNDHISHKRS
ncbi:MAG TPA: ABC transporter ATP-binding protein [bacterium]|nr:ABC transporter ATP-binding protein [bacterium]HPN43942.1 ABC transporter ATP-binding protein [bacterium]